MNLFDRENRSARALMLALCLIGSGAIVGLSAEGAPGRSSAAESEVLIPDTFADLAEQALPSVVSVYVKHDIREQMRAFRRRMEQNPDSLRDPRLRRFFEQQEPEEGEEEDPHEGTDAESRTSGSGVIIRGDGYIVTNNHIVQGAREGSISVVLNDGTEFEGDQVKLLATDSLLDLAVLKIDPEGRDLQPMAWGDSESMRIGEWVMAIGNPLNLSGSVSKGIVSGKGRKIGRVGIEDLIQTDAMINPGNSGGALINLKGELIGINMAIATNSGFFQGIGFAIPSNDARFITEQVIENGRIRRGYIGISMQPLQGGSLRDALGLEQGVGGILVEEVMQGTPADKAGVEPYDVITAVDELEIEDIGDLLRLIAGKRVGETALLTILRGGRRGVDELSLKMKVTERPPDDELRRTRGPVPPRIVEKEKPEKDPLGLELKPYDEGDTKGLEVTEVQEDSAAARAGIAVGDIVLEIDRTSVRKLGDYKKALIRGDTDRPYLVRYFSRAGGRRVIVPVKCAKARN